MAIVIKDRVKEVTSSTGTGAISMGGAVTGFRAFSSAFTTGDQTYYVIEGGSEWEVGKGTLTTGTPWTMSRDTILASSNAGAAVNFSAGTKVVYCDMPASVLVNSRPLMGALVYYPSNVTAQNWTAGTILTGFTAETYDTHGFHDNATNPSRLTIPSGLGITRVRLSGQLKVSALGTAGTFNLRIYKNGVGVYSGEPEVLFASTTASSAAAANISSPPLDCVAGDYFELRVFVTGDTSLDAVATSTWFAIEVAEATTLG